VAPDRSGATFYLVPLDARSISQNGAYILASPARAPVPLAMGDGGAWATTGYPFL
jgi:hypothetical protein